MSIKHVCADIVVFEPSADKLSALITEVVTDGKWSLTGEYEPLRMG